jgi:hypothetical protein
VLFGEVAVFASKARSLPDPLAFAEVRHFLVPFSRRRALD